MPVIEVAGLVVRYGNLTAVAGVSFSADAGEVVALLGPNGAGKTTTVETLVGFRKPDSGRVRVLGLDPVRQHEALTPRIGVMLQEGGVYPGIRPLEVLRLYAAFHDDPESPEIMLERLGLQHRRDATWRQLSGGEQQRLAVACALAGDPELIILDEPTASLDRVSATILVEVLAGVASRGATMVVATHDPLVIDAGQTIAELDHGRRVR